MMHPKQQICPPQSCIFSYRCSVLYLVRLWFW